MIGRSGVGIPNKRRKRWTRSASSRLLLQDFVELNCAIQTSVAMGCRRMKRKKKRADHLCLDMPKNVKHEIDSVENVATADDHSPLHDSGSAYSWSSRG